MAMHELNGGTAVAVMLALVAAAGGAAAQTETVPQASYVPPSQAEQAAPASQGAASGQGAPQTAPQPAAAPADQGASRAASAPQSASQPGAAASQQAAPAQQLPPIAPAASQQAAPAPQPGTAQEPPVQASGQVAPLPQRIGDSLSLTAGVPITAPNTVDAGQTVNVVVENAVPGALIELWGPVTQEGRGQRLAAGTLTGGAAALTAPDFSGSYELRYLDASGAQLGRRAFDVAAVPVALTLQTPVERSGALDVTWQGPATPGDRFEIVGPAGVVVDSTPVAGSPFTANVSTLTAPAETGPYELRYVSGRGGVLRSVGFAVR